MQQDLLSREQIKSIIFQIINFYYEEHGKSLLESEELNLYEEEEYDFEFGEIFNSVRNAFLLEIIDADQKTVREWIDFLYANRDKITLTKSVSSDLTWDYFKEEEHF